MMGCALFTATVNLVTLTWLHMSDYRTFGTLKDGSLLNDIVKHQTIILAAETSSKMVSTFCHK